MIQPVRGGIRDNNAVNLKTMLSVLCSASTEVQRQIIDGISVRRLGKPEDIANSVVFLASGLAEWVTGQVLEVNGGR